MLRLETVASDTFSLLQELQSKEYLQDFVLVGGTALSLQLGHRISVDLDLFTRNDFDVAPLRERLELDFGFFTDVSKSQNTILGFVKNVKVDFVTHKYPYVGGTVKQSGVNLASLEDIAAMKLSAISDNGTRVKDFIDIYYLLRHYTLSELVSFFEKKYSMQNSFHVMKGLSYFDDIILNDYPDLLHKVEWADIRQKLHDEVVKYTKENIEEV